MMGLPRASGKRRWSGDDDEDDDQSPSKVVCTSPPYALCAEYLLPTHPPTPNRLPATSKMEVTLDECEATRLTPDNEESLASDCDDALSDRPQYDDEGDDDNFIDDEEDKDSGFIDGNSIDNSSDDDCDAKGDASFASSSTSLAPVTSSSSKEEPAKPIPEPSLQISLSKVLPTSSSQLPTTYTTCTTCITTCSSPICSLPDSSLSSRLLEVKGDFGVTTVTATQTATIVTTTYQGSVPSHSYDLHAYQTSSYTSELYQSRPCTPPWSCTFYDGSQPTTTNKYMEISPNRSLTGQQSIQCDENGKSYLELGSASPYTNTYSNDCGNFTTSPSSYNGSSYSQTFSGTPTYPTGNSYFNNRTNYSSNSPYGYHGSESYATYDGEGGCSYGYINGGYSPHNPGRSHGIPIRMQPQRCASPICDPTRTSPRPACYPQQRLSVLNLSMFKLNRFSRFPEPSLHRSVLICNTLRHIEREMEAEGLNMAAILAHSHTYRAHVQSAGTPPTVGTHCPDVIPSMPSANTSGEGPLPSIHSSLIGPPLHSSPHPATPPPSTSMYSSDALSTYSSTISYAHDARDCPSPFESSREETLPLRPFSPPPPSILGDRQTLLSPSEALPQEEDADSIPTAPSQRLCEDQTESINWCSVLSLSSQTDLDSMNNNECHEWNNEGESSSTFIPLTNRESSLPLGGSVPIHYSSEGENSDSNNLTPNWKLPSLSADDVLKSFPEPSRRQEEDLDSIIKVLVGS